jgi:DNA-binding response OmpR family regulator
MAVRSEVQRVLVIDSDATIRDQLTRILKSAGYEIFLARDGGEARSQAAQHPIDLVICSLGVPEAERLETVRAIAAERPRVRIVATAGALDTAALKAADLLGAQAVLTKPVAAQTVLRRVRELLKSRPFPYVADEETAPSFPPASPRGR